MSESLFDPNGPSPQTVDSFLIDGFTDPDEILEVAEDLTTEQKKRWAKGFKDKLPGAKKRLQGKVDQYERERAKENEELLDLGVEILDVAEQAPGIRDVKFGVSAGARDIASLVARPFAPKLSDEINREVGFEAQAHEFASEDQALSLVTGGLRDATRSMTLAIPASMAGAPAMIGIFGASEMNQAWTESTDAGLRGKERWKYVGRAGAIEVLVTAAMQKIGAGGMEKMLSANGRLMKPGAVEWVKRLGINIPPESIEENAIQIMHLYNSQISGMGPDVTMDMIAETLKRTTVSTIFSTGGIGTMQGVMSQKGLKQREPLVQGMMQIHGFTREQAVGVLDRAAKGENFDEGYAKEIQAERMKTPAGAVEWAATNRDKARELASKEKPSRKDFENADLPTMDAKQRQDFANNVERTMNEIDQSKAELEDTYQLSDYEPSNEMMMLRAEHNQIRFDILDAQEFMANLPEDSDQREVVQAQIDAMVEQFAAIDSAMEALLVEEGAIEAPAEQAVEQPPVQEPAPTVEPESVAPDPTQPTEVAPEPEPVTPEEEIPAEADTLVPQIESMIGHHIQQGLDEGITRVDIADDGETSETALNLDDFEIDLDRLAMKAERGTLTKADIVNSNLGQVLAINELDDALAAIQQDPTLLDRVGGYLNDLDDAAQAEAAIEAEDAAPELVVRKPGDPHQHDDLFRQQYEEMDLSVLEMRQHIRENQQFIEDVKKIRVEDLGQEITQKDQYEMEISERRIEILEEMIEKAEQADEVPADDSDINSMMLDAKLRQAEKELEGMKFPTNAKKQKQAEVEDLKRQIAEAKGQEVKPEPEPEPQAEEELDLAEIPETIEEMSEAQIEALLVDAINAETDTFRDETGELDPEIEVEAREATEQGIEALKRAQKEQSFRQEKREKVQQAKEELNQEISNLARMFREKGMMANAMLDPELVKGTGIVLAKAIKLGFYKFDEAFSLFRDQFKGKSQIEALYPYVARAWNNLRKTHKAFEVLDEAPEDVRAPSATEQAERTTPDARLAENIATLLVNTEGEITEDRMFELADEAFEGTRAEGKYGPSDAYDAMELGVNMAIKQQFDLELDPAIETMEPENVMKVIERIDKLLARIPKQKNRSGEKDAMQQFSTPPAYALAVNWIAGIYSNDTVLEPSAGTGDLAVWAKVFGATVIGNELSARRADLLRQLGLDLVTTENAEQMHNIMPGRLEKEGMPAPTVVVMNPPFSRAAHRMGNKRIIGTDLKHISSALKALAPGGRLVAITGSPLQLDKRGENKSFLAWLEEISDDYNVRANVHVGREVYGQYGTNFPTRVLVIDKTGPTTAPVESQQVADIKELVYALSEVRNEREAPEGTGVDQRDTGVEPSDTGGRPEAGTGEVRPTDDGSAADSEAATGTTGVPDSGQSGKGDQDARRGKRGDTGRRGESRADRDELSGSTEQQPATGTTGPRSESGLKRGEAQKAKQEELSDRGYEEYTVQKAVFDNSKPHMASLDESAAMAAVELPDLTYTPNLPTDVIESGELSDVQLERVAYAGESHSKTLPPDKDGVERRRGFMIGDGTGTGKTRSILGIFRDNYRQGRKKAILVSKNADLLAGARSNMGPVWEGEGKDPKKFIFELGKTPASMKDEAGNKLPGIPQVKQSEGIIYTTYGTLGHSAGQTRLQQLVDWVGEDFDGVLVFDEAHTMGNALEGDGKLGGKGPSKAALMGIELQKMLPNARVVYATATAATEVRNMVYADRLGLWGPGTPFIDAKTFVSQVSAAGLAAMEQVAQDLKARGLYMAAQITLNDGTPEGTVEYERVQHDLSEEQTMMYDRMVEAWNVVLQNIEEALGITGANSRAKSYILSQFWSSNQRFYQQIMSVMSMPSVLAKIREDIDNNRSVVIQLTDTGDAAMERALANQKEGEEIDLSPFNMLVQYVKNTFPVQEFEPYIDDNGNKQTRPVVDADDKPVLNREAVAKRDALIADLESMASEFGMFNPIDMIYNEFSDKMVGEVTGRKNRVYRDPRTGERKVIPIKGKYKNASMQDFQNGQKRILIFSRAGGTGFSYHSDLRVPNQQQRSHYILQPGWSASEALQGLGRTHRTNQASAPQVRLVSTDLPSQKRFLSTIAKRLDQLGALTKGQRDAGSGGVFSAADSLSSQQASDALRLFYEGLFDGSLGIEVMDFEAATGLKLTDEDGRPLQSAPPAMEQFLNRMLNMPVTMQNDVFSAFEGILKERVRIAEEAGTIDAGMETIKAESVEVLDEEVAWSDEASGASVIARKLDISRKVRPTRFDEISNKASGRSPSEYIRNIKNGNLYAVVFMSPEFDAKSGKMIERARLVSPHSVRTEPAKDVRRRMASEGWERLNREEARGEWEKKADALEGSLAHDEAYIFSGALLSVWDRMKQTGNRLYRVLTNDGQVLLGRLAFAEDADVILHQFGMKGGVSADRAWDTIMAHGRVALNNGWVISINEVNDEDRIEIKGPTFAYASKLEGMGAFVERINFKQRYFIPVGEKARGIFDALAQEYGIKQVFTAKPPSNDGSEDAPGSPDALNAPDVGFPDSDTPAMTAEAQEAATRERLKRDPVQKRDIIDFIRKHWMIPIRSKGTFRKRAAGWFSPGATEIRLRDDRDIVTAFHELGHHIDWTTNKRWSKHQKNQSIAKELVQLGKDLYGDRKPPGGYKSEGMAEFIAAWIAEESDLKERAPNLYAYFVNEYLPAHPKTAEGLNKLQGLLKDWIAMGDIAQVKAFITPYRKAWSTNDILSRAWEWVDEKLIDINSAVVRAMEAGGVDRSMLKAKDDPFMLLTKCSMAAGGKLLHAATSATTDLADQVTGESLRDALSPVTQQGNEAYENFKLYIVALRARDLMERGIQSGLTAKNIETTIEAFDSPAFMDAAERVSAWSQRILRLLVESGKIDSATYRRIVEANPIYVPFMRQFEDGEIRADLGKSKTGKGLYQIRGSGREIHDPIEALLMQAEKVISMAMSTDVLRALVKVYGDNIVTRDQVNQGFEGANDPGIANMMVEVPAPRQSTTFGAEQIKKDVAGILAKKGADMDELFSAFLDNWDESLTVFTDAPEYRGRHNIVAIDIDGTRRWFEVSPKLYKVIRNLNRRDVLPGGLGWLSRKAVGLQRLGATGLNPGFGLIRNFQRDAVTSMVTADFSKGGPLAPFRGLINHIRDTEMNQRYHAAGVQLAGWIGQDTRRAGKLIKKVKAVTKGQRRMVTVMEPIEALRELFSITEVGPRLAEYADAYNQAIERGEDAKSAAVIAAVAAKDITVNFTRAGEYGRYLNEIFLFFNAAVQSIDKMGRSFKEAPKRTVARGLVYITFISMLNYWRNRDEEWWKEYPAYEKWRYTHWRIPDTDTVLRAPLPFEFGALFGALPVAMIEEARTPGSLIEAVKLALEGAIPNDWPAVIGPIIDVLTNEDWAERPIVPQNIKENRKPEDQYTQHTTEFAKMLGAMINESPAQIEHLVNAYSGGLYRRLARTLENIGDPSFFLEEPANIPVVGTLFARKDTSRVAGDFYKRKKELQQSIGSGDATLAERGEYSAMQSLSSDLSEKWAEIRGLQGENTPENRAKGKEIRRQISADIKKLREMTEQEREDLALQKAAYAISGPTPSEKQADLKALLKGQEPKKLYALLAKEYKKPFGNKHYAARIRRLNKVMGIGR